MRIRPSVLLALPLSAFLTCGALPRTGQAHEGARVAPEAHLALNKSVVRRVYEEGLSQGKFEVPYTDDFVGHGGGTATFTHAQGIAEATGWRSAFPDLRVEVDLLIAEGDFVTVRWTARGTNTGAGQGIPATGRRVQTSGTTIFRLALGKIAEEWTAGDSLGLLRQLGLMPPAAVGARPTQ